MNDTLFTAIALWLDDGAAPGGAVALLSPDAEPAYFAHGNFSDKNSPLATPDTVYDVASVTKLFTAALILRLHEQKRLSINDPCALYLPNFQHSDLRIIDLLTHRLGINLSLAQFSQQFEDAASFRSALLALDPTKEPIDHIEYANIQLFYAGAIIETVTGHALDDELHHLFTELGLGRTATGPDVAERYIITPPTEVIGDTVIQGTTHDESSRKLGGIAGNAGVFSSAVDLASFGKAWLDGRIVSRELLDDIVFKNYDPAGTTSQAFGWWLRATSPDGNSRPTPGIYSHTGFTGPILAINPNNGKVAAFTCNRTYYGRDNKLHRQIWQLLITWLQS